MKYIGRMEKKQEIGWKVIEKNGMSYKTPYQGVETEDGGMYYTKREKEEGIYIFLNETNAKKFKKWIEVRYGSFNFSIAQVRLGNHIWQEEVDSHDGFTNLDIEYFYTTNAIEVLNIT